MAGTSITIPKERKVSKESINRKEKEKNRKERNRRGYNKRLLENVTYGYKMKTKEDLKAIEDKVKAARAISDWETVVELKISITKARCIKKRGWVVLRKTWLTSSINYRMALEEIAVFSKIIVMADEFGPVPGLISDNDFRPMPHDYLAHQACCPLEILEATIKKGIEDDSIYENSHGVFLTHFDEYQFTEYDRQKPWREAKKAREAIDPGKYTQGPLGKIAQENAQRKIRELATREAKGDE